MQSKNKTPKKVKKQKTGILNEIKGFFKELKRVRWPNGSESFKIFWTSLIFIIIAAIVLFLITLGFTTLWEKWGVGL
ncbi:preprotein translocase subunit SecE [Mycoplasma marinum]|uniref:Protein translocase subunit SecE n=1 Tax=Mycoplasma marinum TaxID=1937190 RepID=A0A4R0XTP0_9MOLU|nr:preprotein translocase subunit SecE [Mycoplasma marinum]TCG11876.1 preprotein translocase subunit SecE [Mycoplasma marinum]